MPAFSDYEQEAETVEAFLNLCCEGQEKVVITSLSAPEQERDEIRSVDMIADPYNTIAEVEVPDMDAPGDLATKNIEHRQDNNLSPREARTTISTTKYSMKT